LVLAGSFNFTRTADEHNAEKLLVINDPVLYRIFEVVLPARLVRRDLQRHANSQLETGMPKTETPGVRWKKITLVGVGLLGGSLGLALRKRRLAGSIVGFVRRAASMAECEALGAVHVATRDLFVAVEGAELIVLCTPIAQMRSLVERMLPALRPGAIVTDVGSVKGSVVRDLESLVARAGAHFVGSHPLAGAEKMGVAAARDDLFAGAVCVVTPTRKSNRAAVRRVEQLWKSVGTFPLRLTPEAHDDLVSRSSHLPHVVAAQLARLILSPGHSKEQGMVCANGFRDTTRIASSSPEMWRDIALANRRNLSRALGTFTAGLQEFRRVLKNWDAQAISEFFEQARERRERWSKRTGCPSPE
jgi:prephenate dehydrogenase